jgi:hypothetical protein
MHKLRNRHHLQFHFTPCQKNLERTKSRPKVDEINNWLYKGLWNDIELQMFKKKSVYIPRNEKKTQVSEKSEIGRSRGAGEVPKLIRLLEVFSSAAIVFEDPDVDGRGGSVNNNEDENGIPLPIPIPIPAVSGITAGAAYI